MLEETNENQNVHIFKKLSDMFKHQVKHIIMSMLSGDTLYQLFNSVGST